MPRGAQCVPLSPLSDRSETIEIEPTVAPQCALVKRR